MNSTAKRALAAIAVAVAIVAPLVMTSFGLTVATSAVIFAIFAVSLNIILGHGGLPSLGHAAFFGVSAYTVAMLQRQGITSFWLILAAAIAVAVVLGLVIGPLLLRTRELYFLMTSLALAEILRNMAISWRSFTGGDDGIAGLSRPSLLGLNLNNDSIFYYFTLFWLLLTVAVVGMLMNSPFGHSLRGVRDNRTRMSVLGARPFSIEFVAFVISAGFAGIAGALFAYGNGFVAPSLLSVEVSGRVLLMVALGGPATAAGPIVGAVVIEGIRGLGSAFTDRWVTLLGIVYILVALMPRERMPSPLRRLRRGGTTGEAAATTPTAAPPPEPARSTGREEA